MRKLAILLVGCWTTSAWAVYPDPNLLFYDGFDYADGAALSPAAVSTDQNDPANQGQLHADSGKYWFSAGTGARPIISTGSVWYDNTMPAATGNRVNMTFGNSTSSRIEIPNVPSIPATDSRTMYYSGYLRMDQMLDGNGAGLGSAPSLRTAAEAGVFVAGFNNTPGPQTGNLSVHGGSLLLKRASAVPGSDLATKYYVGVTPNNLDQCTVAANWSCSDRNYADYNPDLDPAVNVLADGSELPSVYLPDSARDDVRRRYPAVPLALGETVFVVASITTNPGAGNDVARLWINPDVSTFSASDPPLPLAEPDPMDLDSFINTVACPEGSVSCGYVETPAVLGTDMNLGAGQPADLGPARSFFLRMNAASPFDNAIDELRIGTTWASVTGGSNAAPELVGDYNDDGIVDAADYVTFRANEGTTNTLPNDPTGGTIGTAQYDQWTAHFGEMAAGGGSAGAVPEPSTVLLVILAAGWSVVGSCRNGRRHRR